MNLLTSRPSKETERLLYWYYCISPSEMGVRSNFGSMVAAINGVSSQEAWEDPYTDRTLDTVHRHRRIHAAVRAIHPSHQAVLEVAYEPRIYDTELTLFFGPERVGVAVSVHGAAWLLEQNPLVLQGIRMQVDSLWTAAHQAVADALV